MNSFSKRPFSGVLTGLLLCMSTAVELLGQGSGPLKQLVTAKDMMVRDTISGMNLDINVVSPMPQHGTVTTVILQSGGSGNPYIYEVRYMPDPGFTGVDTFALEYNYIGVFPYLSYQATRVAIYPSILKPQADFATTTAGTPVTIDVLSNDVKSNPPLQIQSIPLSNHGTAAVVNNQIEFTPSQGFTGVAHLNYTVCDGLNHCKTGTLTVGVNNNAAPSNDTLRIATARNTQITVPLTYDSFALFQAPSNGTLQIMNGGYGFRYKPNNAFTGNDQFVLVNHTFNPPAYKTVLLNVLNTPTQNTMAMDDYVFTPKNAPITFNVRNNDIGNLTVKSWVTPPNFPGTLTNKTPGGNVTFTPNNGFTGVATFMYRIGNVFIPDLETGAVHVIVGNLPPSAGTFDLTTPMETPLVINYEIPFIGFDFAITDAPNHGACDYFPGFSTHTINGQTVSGHNLLIYTPDDGYQGADEFEVDYCVPSNGECKSVKIVANVVDVLSADGPYCVDDCVWTGDINHDGIVNNKDILPLGYFMGFDGLTRADAALEWYGQHADDWHNPYAEFSRDLKHCDTDGDGAITAADTLALSVFYGQTHQLTPSVPTASKGLPFFLEIHPPQPQPGDYVTVKVSLGNNNFPVTDLYGFTFDVSLSPQIVDSALHMNFYDNTWINLNAPFLDFWKSPRPGRLETAFTRTNGVSAHGKGPIGELGFVIIDIIDITRPDKLGASAPESFTITVDNPSILWGDNTLTTGQALEIEVPLQTKSRLRDELPKVSDEDFILYPSPAQDLLQIHLNGNDRMESLTIMDMTGKVAYQSGLLQHEHLQVSLSALPEGMYAAVARTQSGRVVKKFQVLRR
jgi:hypothetical protein